MKGPEYVNHNRIEGIVPLCVLSPDVEESEISAAYSQITRLMEHKNKALLLIAGTPLSPHSSDEKEAIKIGDETIHSAAVFKLKHVESRGVVALDHDDKPYVISSVIHAAKKTNYSTYLVHADRFTVNKLWKGHIRKVNGRKPDSSPFSYHDILLSDMTIMQRKFAYVQSGIDETEELILTLAFGYGTPRRKFRTIEELTGIPRGSLNFILKRIQRKLTSQHQ